MSAPTRKRAAPNYFFAHRPQGDTIKAKAARAQIAAASRPQPGLARVLFLELAGKELFAALAAKGHLRLPVEEISS